MDDGVNEGAICISSNSAKHANAINNITTVPVGDDFMDRINFTHHQRRLAGNYEHCAHNIKADTVHLLYVLTRRFKHHVDEFKGNILLAIGGSHSLITTITTKKGINEPLGQGVAPSL